MSLPLFLCILVTVNGISTEVRPRGPDTVDLYYDTYYGMEEPDLHDPRRFTSLAQIQRLAPNWQGDAIVASESGQYEMRRLDQSQFLGQFLVMIFYPADFSFVCPTEIIAFSHRLDEFRKLNTEVVAVSVDSKFAHLAFANTPPSEGGVEGSMIPLVSDITKQISRDYGVLVPEQGVALRGLFIIDTLGVLRHSSIDDLTVGRSVDETVRLIKAYQFADSNEVLCPCDWQPGDETIKPHPRDSKDYFSKYGRP